MVSAILVVQMELFNKEILAQIVILAFHFVRLVIFKPPTVLLVKLEDIFQDQTMVHV